MRGDRSTALATAIVAATGALWGLYWLPVRQLSGLGLPGAWGTVAITLAAAVMLAPFAVLRWRRLAATGPVALASVALGGAAFALYSIGFNYGRVAIIILLYFLTPVWSTLIGRFVMGWPVTRMRALAIGVGLAGLAVMLGADGAVPLPRGAGEWMALAAGILWSVATTGLSSRGDLDPVAASFVFALGAAALALAAAPMLEPPPGHVGDAPWGAALGLSLLSGGLWWGLSMVGLMWATVRLEPARVGIVLMTEVLVGAVSAAFLAGEHLTRPEMAGGAMVLAAGLIEVWPARRGARAAGAGRKGGAGAR